MRLTALFSALFALFSTTAYAQWQKINDVDYTFGPFKIYNVSLFTETGDYHPNIRPIMLTFKYDKPVDGRDFAISLAKSWTTLDLKVPNQNSIINRLRKTFPNIEPNDTLHYIALADRGYFMLNDTVLSEEFSSEANDAIVATWLDSRVEIGKKITVKRKENAKTETVFEPAPTEPETASKPEAQAVEKTANSANSQTAQAKADTAEKPALVATESAPNTAETAPKPEAQAVEKTENSANSQTAQAKADTAEKPALVATESAPNTTETAPKPEAQAVEKTENSANPQTAQEKVATAEKPASEKQPKAAPVPVEKLDWADEAEPMPIIDAPILPLTPLC